MFRFIMLTKANVDDRKLYVRVVKTLTELYVIKIVN